MAENRVVHWRDRSLQTGRTVWILAPCGHDPVVRPRDLGADATVLARRPQGRRSGAAGSLLASRRSPPPKRSITPAHPPQLAHVWEQVRSELRRSVDPQSAELWLDPLRPVELDGERLVLAA